MLPSPLPFSLPYAGEGDTRHVASGGSTVSTDPMERGAPRRPKPIAGSGSSGSGELLPGVLATPVRFRAAARLRILRGAGLRAGFFAHLLEANTLSRACRDKGHLRTFLLGSLQHFMAKDYHRATALKRGGGKQIVSLEDCLIEAEAAVGSNPEADETSATTKIGLPPLRVGRGRVCLRRLSRRARNPCSRN